MILVASIFFSALINFLFVKKIIALKKQQAANDEQIKKLLKYSKELALAINEIQNYLLQQENTNKKSSDPFFKLPKGEA